MEIEQADLHAKDVLYPTSCYKAYTSQRALEVLLKKEEADEESVGSPHAKAFQKLVMELEATIFADPNCVRILSDLTQLYNSYLAEKGFGSNYRP